MRPIFTGGFGSAAAVGAAASAAVSAATAAAVAVAGKQDQDDNENQPDAGAVIVGAHLHFTSLPGFCTILCREKQIGGLADEKTFRIL